MLRSLSLLGTVRRVASMAHHMISHVTLTDIGLRSELSRSRAVISRYPAVLRITPHHLHSLFKVNLRSCVLE